MNSVLSFINEILNWLSSNPIYVYGILVVGVYFTIQMRFVNVRYFKKGWQLMFSKKGGNGNSSCASAMLAIGARVGTGNIAGVTFAIMVGGPGAIFWMWVAAFFVMATSFIETTLGQLYKEKKANGDYVGGPSYYIEKGLGKNYKWLAKLYAIVMIITFSMFYLSVQTSTIITSVYTAFNITLMSGLGILLIIVLAVLTAFTTFGGMNKLMKISSVIVPIMTIGYAILVGLIIIMNISFVPTFFKLVITQAFAPLAIFGGSIGIIIQTGVKRGIFSNEAGQGSGAIAGASSNVAHPVEQAFVQMNTIFIDTFVICTLTAFVVILALYTNGQGAFMNYQDSLGFSNASQTMADIQSNVPPSLIATLSFNTFLLGGGKLLAMFLFFFAFSSIISDIAYGYQNLSYLTRESGVKKTKVLFNIYSIMTIVMVLITPFLLQLAKINPNFDLFSMADNLASLLFYSNIFALIVLLPYAKVLLRDYEKQLASKEEIKFDIEKLPIKIKGINK